MKIFQSYARIFFGSPIRTKSSSCARSNANISGMTEVSGPSIAYVATMVSRFTFI